MKAIELSILTALPSQVDDAPAYLVAMCSDWTDAVRLCMDLSRVRYTRRKWAEILGMQEGTLSQLLNQSGGRKRHPDPAMFPVIEQRAGNRAISQFFWAQSHGQLDSQNARLARINDLKAELAALEQQA